MLSETLQSNTICGVCWLLLVPYTLLIAIVVGYYITRWFVYKKIVTSN